MISYKLLCLFGLACTFILTLIPSASSFSCYECNSIVDTDCELEKPPDRFIVNCTAKPEEHSVRCYECNSTIDKTCYFQIPEKYLKPNCTPTPEVTPIKCFECNSNIDKNCSLKTPPDYLIRDCARNPEGINYDMCRKITQTIDFEVNGLKPDHRIIRSCAYEHHSDTTKDCYQRSGFGGRQEVCSCPSELCNNSNNIKINFSILLAGVSILVFSMFVS